MRRHWYDRQKGKLRQTLHGPNIWAFNADQEKERKSCIIELADIGFAVGLIDIRPIVRNYVSANETECPQAVRLWGQDKLPGPDWLTAFMKRNQLSLKHATKLSVPRFNATKNSFVIFGFYDLLEKTIRDMGIGDRPDLIWNVDETGFPDDPNNCRLVSGIGQKTVQIVAGAGRDNTTVVVVVSASGSHQPPLIIFKAKRVQSTWRPSVPPGQPQPWIDANPSGWIDSDIFFKWFEKWEETTRSYTGHKLEKRLLIFDGHLSHLYLETLRLARKQRVFLMKLPAHTTELLQPTDVAVMKPLKDAWSAELTDRLRGDRKPLSKRQFAEKLVSIWPRCCSVANITSGFKKAGIFSRDRSCYPAHRFDPVLLNDYHAWEIDEDKDPSTLTLARIDGTEVEPEESQMVYPTPVDTAAASPVPGPSSEPGTSTSVSGAATPTARGRFETIWVPELQLPAGVVSHSAPSPRQTPSPAVLFREAVVRTLSAKTKSGGQSQPATKRRRVVNPHGELVTSDEQFAKAVAEASALEAKARKTKAKPKVRRGLAIVENQDGAEAEPLESDEEAQEGVTKNDLWRQLINTWSTFQHDSVDDEHLRSVWYAGLYKGKKLYYGRICSRSGDGDIGPVRKLEVNCLAYKSTAAEGHDYSWPPCPDVDFFAAHDIIAGPLDVEVLPERAARYRIAANASIRQTLPEILKLDRAAEYRHRFPGSAPSLGGASSA